MRADANMKRRRAEEEGGGRGRAVTWEGERRTEVGRWCRERRRRREDRGARGAR